MHVDDYADAVVTSLRSPLREGVFDITAEHIRNGDYLDGVADRFGLARPPRDPEAPRSRSYRCSSTAARETLGWALVREIWPAAAS